LERQWLVRFGAASKKHICLASAFMTTFRASARYLIGWLILATAALGQAPQGPGDVDPSCPNCAQNRLAAHHDAPPLGLPPQGLSPHAFSPQELPPHGLPVGALPPPHGAPIALDEECPLPMVRVRTRVAACAEVGKELEYRIKVENTSPADAHNVIVRMSLPASVRILRASPQPHQQIPDLQWNLGTMPGHGCHDLVVVVMPIGLADVKACTRVTFEHGQCCTTKVIATAPPGSADGKTPPGGPFDPMVPGGIDPNRGRRPDFDVKVTAPADASLDKDVVFEIIIYNRSNQPVFGAGATIEWSRELDFVRADDPKLIQVPPVQKEWERLWPSPAFPMIPPNSLKKLELTLRSKLVGRFCVKAVATASTTENPIEGKALQHSDQACTEFRRLNAGMTLEMVDRDDPILKDGQTSFPITVRNQGQSPVTNLLIKARVSKLFEVDKVDGPVKYRTVPEANQDVLVVYEPLAVLGVGEAKVYEIAVRGKGAVGDGRVQVQMTADQLDKDVNGQPRWIFEEESTTLVPDEETRERIRQISRDKARDRKVAGTVTNSK
jgi:uncharacterized repeat protein (TIGR01451 family)